MGTVLRRPGPLGLVYIGVGEGLNDDYGGHRPGANLFPAIRSLPSTRRPASASGTSSSCTTTSGTTTFRWRRIFSMSPSTGSGARSSRQRPSRDGCTSLIASPDGPSGRCRRPRSNRARFPANRPGRRNRFRRSRRGVLPQQGLLASDLIDYTPAIKDSALSGSPSAAAWGRTSSHRHSADGRGANGPAKYTCSWYAAPGAAGGVNIDGGTAADPETGMIYVGGQSGVQPGSASRRTPAPSTPTARCTTAAVLPGRFLRRRDTSRLRRHLGAVAAGVAGAAACR